MAGCHQTQVKSVSQNEINRRILLIGNPNVGKSVFFSKMTGIHVVSSNYTGTTVTYTEGKIKIAGSEYTLIDVPGIYSTEPTSEAESVAAAFLHEGALAVICVLDASNLQRSVKLALEIKQFDLPIVFTLNLMDVAARQGTEININLLSQELGYTVIPTVAVKNEGLANIAKNLEAILSRQVNSSENIKINNFTACSLCPASCPGCHEEKSALMHRDLWQRAALITRRVRKQTNRKPTFLDKLGDKMIKPWPGIIIALAVISLSLGIIVGGGKALRSVLLLPLVNQVIVPFFRRIFTALIPAGIVQNILVGEFGIFVISFEWIMALILPYVFLFYLVFSFLEDSGYLPRASVLFDSIMRKIGIQGGSLITLSMGLGCAVPAIIGSRTATTHKERLIVSTMVCFAVPCISQTGALISLLGSHSYWLLGLMVVLAMFILMLVSLILGRIIKGKMDSLILELPNLLLPDRKAYLKKLIIRMRHFMLEAELPMLLSIVIAALLKETGLLDYLAVRLEPLVSGWLGLPREAVIALILGIVRREMAAAPLLALNLSGLQIFTGAAVALLYLPCISVFAVLTKEFKLKTALMISLATIISAFLVGGLINQVGRLFLW